MSDERVEVAAPERVLEQARRAQPLAGGHPRDAQLDDPAAGVGDPRRPVDARDRHAQHARATEVDRQAVPPGPQPEAAAANLDLGRPGARVVEREQLDGRHVARHVQLDLEPVARELAVRGRHPGGARRSVERGERPRLGELRGAGKRVLADVPDALVLGHGLGRRAGVERIEERGVGRRIGVCRQRRTHLLAGTRGDDHAPPVAVADHDVGARAGGSPQLAGGAVGGVGQRTPGVERPEGGEAGERVRRAVDERLRAGRRHPHDPLARRHVVAGDLRQARGRRERPRLAADLALRAVAAIRVAEPAAGELASGARGHDRAAARPVIVGAGDHRPGAEQPQQRRELPLDHALLLDQVVGAPQEVDGPPVGVGEHRPRRHRPVAERGQDRVDRRRPVVGREQLGGKHDRARVGRQAGVEVARRRRPRGRDLLPGQLRVDRLAADQRPDREQEHGGERQRGPARAQPDGGRCGGGEHGERHHEQRRRLVGRAQELDGVDAEVDRERRPPQRRAVREPGAGDQRPAQQEQEEERGVCPGPGVCEGEGDQGRHEQRRHEHGGVEEHHPGVGGERPQVVAVADADVRGPVAHQAQDLGGAGRAPDHPRWLGERQEVAAVEHVGDHRRHPPQRRHGEAGADAQPERPGVAPAHRADRRLVDEQRERREQQPRQHRHVHAAAGRRDDQRTGRRPPPAARVAQPAVHGEQHPRQQRVGQQRDRRAVEEDHDVRVEQEHGARRQPRRRAASREERVGEPHGAHDGDREDGTEPQPVREPGRQPGQVAEREERAHREQVARVLPGVHMAEVAGRRPHRRHVREEADGVHVQVDLRVRRRHPGPLHERRGEGEHGEDDRVAPGSAGQTGDTGHRPPQATARGGPARRAGIGRHRDRVACRAAPRRPAGTAVTATA